jgi:hypothetical protein
MARSSVRTWLALDRWAYIVGLNPLHFNQLVIAGHELSCGDVWFQEAWQNAGAISRDDVALAIQLAEKKVADYVGYNLMPDWTIAENKNTDRALRPEDRKPVVNVRGQKRSVNTRNAYYISGGVRTNLLVEADVIVTYSDEDSDGYSETATMSIITDIDPCELRVYFAGKSGSDAYEVRPIETSVSAGVVTITAKAWQLVNPSKQTGLFQDALDGMDTANYATAVDVYRVYNNPSQQLDLIWSKPECSFCDGAGCVQCTLELVSGCLTAREPRLGIVTYVPAEWDDVNQRFNYSVVCPNGEPDRMRLYYYSGYIDERSGCPSRDMSPDWEQYIAHYSLALLNKRLCGCEGLQAQSDYYRVDLGMSGEISFNLSARDIANPFGTTRGALDVFRKCSMEGVRIGR